MFKRLATVAFVAELLGATAALAASGSYIGDIKSAGTGAPKCVQFWTTDGDTTTYTFSVRDTNFINNLAAIRGNKLNHILGIADVITFATGTPSSGVGVDFFPGDCTVGTYVYGITD